MYLYLLHLALYYSKFECPSLSSLHLAKHFWPYIIFKKLFQINNRISRVSQFTNDISQCMESQASQVERAELYITNSASNWLDDVFDKLNR